MVLKYQAWIIINAIWLLMVYLYLIEQCWFFEIIKLIIAMDLISIIVMPCVVLQEHVKYIPVNIDFAFNMLITMTLAVHGHLYFAVLSFIATIVKYKKYKIIIIKEIK